MGEATQQRQIREEWKDVEATVTAGAAPAIEWPTTNSHIYLVYTTYYASDNIVPCKPGFENISFHAPRHRK